MTGICISMSSCSLCVMPPRVILPTGWISCILGTATPRLAIARISHSVIPVRPTTLPRGVARAVLLLRRQTYENYLLTGRIFRHGKFAAHLLVQMRCATLTDQLHRGLLCDRRDTVCRRISSSLPIHFLCQNMKGIYIRKELRTR
jgi:hypothetical protein